MRKTIVIVLVLLACLGASKANVVFTPFSEDEDELIAMILRSENVDQAVGDLVRYGSERCFPLLIDLVEDARPAWRPEL